MSRLDHGLLNLPLAKRGNIDAQIDRFKAEQAKETRRQDTASFHRVRAQKARVRELLDRIGDYRVLQLATPLGARTAKKAREALYRAALSNLDRWIPVLERENIPAGGCATCWAPVGQCDHDGREWLGGGE
jgi:hypothetical protein